MSPSSRASTSKMIGTWMPRMSNCPVIWVVTTPPSVKASGNGRASSRVKVAMGSLGNICSRIYRSRLGWSLSSRCRSISITEGRPSRCTSPERAIVRTTASLGSGSRASFSSTVNVASEPSPTTNVIPSICPKSLCSSVSEIGVIVGVGDGWRTSGPCVGVPVSCGVLRGSALVGTRVATGWGVSMVIVAAAVAVWAGVELDGSPHATIRMVNTAVNHRVHPILGNIDRMAALIKPSSDDRI